MVDIKKIRLLTHSSLTDDGSFKKEAVKVRIPEFESNFKTFISARTNSNLLNQKKRCIYGS